MEESDKDSQVQLDNRKKGRGRGMSDEDSQVQLVERKKKEEEGENALDKLIQVHVVEREKKKEEGEKAPDKSIARKEGSKGQGDPDRPMARKEGNKEKEDDESLEIIQGTEQKSRSDEGHSLNDQEEITPKKDKRVQFEGEGNRQREAMREFPETPVAKIGIERQKQLTLSPMKDSVLSKYSTIVGEIKHCSQCKGSDGVL